MMKQKTKSNPSLEDLIRLHGKKDTVLSLMKINNYPPTQLGYVTAMFSPDPVPQDLSTESIVMTMAPRWVQELPEGE
jgi:hypothetical protein